jgi:hypothetical protein
MLLTALYGAAHRRLLNLMAMRSVWGYAWLWCGARVHAHTYAHVRRARWVDTSTPRGSGLLLYGLLGPPLNLVRTCHCHAYVIVGKRAVGFWAHPPSPTTQRVTRAVKSLFYLARHPLNQMRVKTPLPLPDYCDCLIAFALNSRLFHVFWSLVTEVACTKNSNNGSFVR